MRNYINKTIQNEPVAFSISVGFLMGGLTNSFFGFCLGLGITTAVIYFKKAEDNNEV